MRSWSGLGEVNAKSLEILCLCRVYGRIYDESLQTSELVGVFFSPYNLKNTTKAVFDKLFDIPDSK